MKIKFTLLACLALSSFGFGATISGNFARDFFASTLADPGVPASTLVLAVVDTDDDGFGGDVDLLNPQNISVGQTFGGDLIIGSAATSLAGTAPNQFATVSITINTALAGVNGLGKRFAMIWLPGLTTGATTAGAGQTYGFGTHSTWLTPSVDSGSITFGTGTGQARSLIMDSTNASYTAPVGQAIDGPAPSPDGATYTHAVNAGRTQGGALLTIVPEPSTATLALLAGLGMVARRRRA